MCIYSLCVSQQMSAKVQLLGLYPLLSAVYFFIYLSTVYRAFLMRGLEMLVNASYYQIQWWIKTMLLSKSTFIENIFIQWILQVIFQSKIVKVHIFSILQKCDFHKNLCLGIKVGFGVVLWWLQKFKMLKTELWFFTMQSKLYTPFLKITSFQFPILGTSYRNDYII